MRARTNAIATLLAGALASAWMAGCESVVPPDAEFASEVDPAQAKCYTDLEPSGTSNPLVIGAVLPMTGPDGKEDARGRHRSRAMRLALTEANKRSGVGDRQFLLRICDTGGGWVDSGESAAGKLATWLVKKEGVQTIISGGSGDTLVIQPVTKSAGVLLMSVSGTSMEITDLDDDGLVWRVAPSDRHQGVVLAWLAKEKMKGTPGATVAVMAVNNAYGEGLSKVITDQLPAKIYTQYALKSDGSNLDAELKRANGDDPDVLILAAPASLAGTAVAKLAGHSNLAAAQLYLSDSTHNPDFLQKAGGTAKLASVQGTLPGAPVSKVFKTFQGNYISSFTDDPAQQSFTAHSYDAAYCLALAHAWAMGSAGDGKVNGKALAGGLRQLSNVKAQDFQLAPTNFIPMRSLLMKGDPVDIEGASGLLDFDPDKGEAPSPVGIWEIDDKGAFKAVKWVEVQGSGADSQVVELP